MTSQGRTGWGWAGLARAPHHHATIFPQTGFNSGGAATCQDRFSRCKQSSLLQLHVSALSWLLLARAPTHGTLYDGLWRQDGCAIVAVPQRGPISIRACEPKDRRAGSECNLSVQACPVPISPLSPSAGASYWQRNASWRGGGVARRRGRGQGKESRASNQDPGCAIGSRQGNVPPPVGA